MNLSPLPVQRFYDNDNRPLVGGKLFTYTAGTTTKVATYTDYLGTTPNTNPVIMDFRGECLVWLDPDLAYKFILSPATDTDPPSNPIWSVDHITIAPPSQDNAANDVGTANNVSISIPSITELTTFLRIVFKAAATNTGTTVLTINALPSKQIRTQNRQPLAGAELQSGGIYEVIYDGNYWQLQSPALQPPQQAITAEASVTVVNYWYPPGHVYRYGTNTAPGTTDMTAAINAAANVARAAKCKLIIPGQNMLVSSPLDFSSLHAWGEWEDGGIIQATSAQFNVITTTGNTVLEHFRVDGGWNGVTAGQSGNTISISKLTDDQFPYIVTIRNVVITNAKRSMIYIRRGGYTYIDKVRSLTAGLHGLELEGSGAAAAITTIGVGGKSVFSNTPNGYGIKITDGNSIDLDGLILEDTGGILLEGTDNRAIRIEDVYQENFTNPSTAFLSAAGSAGIGLYIGNCYGGGKSISSLDLWEDVHIGPLSNLSAPAIPLAGRGAIVTNPEGTTAVTGGVTVTASATTALNAGVYLIVATAQTVTATGTPNLTDAGLVITTNNADSGFTTTVTEGVMVPGADRRYGSPITAAAARLNASVIVRLPTGGTVYARLGLNFSAGSVGYNGIIEYFKLS